MEKGRGPILPRKLGGWPWLAPRLPTLWIAAFLLDGCLPGCAFFLGTAAFFPLLLGLALPFSAAAGCAFTLGLLLDSTHPSVPFGFHGFFALGEFFLFRIALRHLHLETLPRLTAAAALATGLHHLTLSIAVPNGSTGPILLSAAAAFAFNACAQLLAHALPRKRIEKTIPLA
ncbi:MAG: hypothetical protein LBT98_00510 [Puniceicoccales bacterium]|nr:hypothetical protein [Puniceicoccales bacterium]